MAKTAAKKKAISYLQAKLNISKSNSFEPVYLIYGEERFLHEDITNRILEKSLDAGSRDFNFDIFFAGDVEVEKVIDIARSYPMMSERRVILVKEIQKFKPAALKKLADYSGKPSETTVLMLIYPNRALTGKSISKIASGAYSINCRPLYEDETMKWIKEFAASKKLEIGTQAVHSLYELVGNSLLDLVNEIEKIQINIAPETKITVENVVKISSMLKLNTVFELCDTVGEKKFKKSISILNNLLSRGEKPTGIVRQLFRHFANLAKIRDSIAQRKGSAGELQKVTRLSPFFINKIKNQARNFSSTELRRSFFYLATADLHLKTSYQPPKLVMELLIYNLIRKQ
ncbi:DNA polymerase III subunit delta [candidate division KSB1 bacterium 4572_119]|nr:MAG: DNA polymerase III subunit delta [candidate division KSB1 bacterium 4572_119]